MRNAILTLLCLANMLCGAQEISFRLAVHDKVNREPIPRANVTLQDLNSLREYKAVSNDSGIATLALAPTDRYRVEVSVKDDGSGTGYLSYTYMLSEKEARSKKTFDAELEKVKHAESGLVP